jgi:L-ascorbate metabolism protein UlaG (beta-lactamase superfamily)
MNFIKWHRGLSLFALFILAATGAIAIFLHTAVFGALPEGERLARIEQSKNYIDGQFRNQVDTPTFSEGNNFLTVNINYLFAKTERLIPEKPLPVVKMDLKNLDPNQDVVIWLGHSGYFIQLNGKRILVDPVLRPRASPVPFGGAAFTGTTPYTSDDFPSVDYLLISHDHYDHLDYPTIQGLKDKTGVVITALGIGQDFARWGYPESKIHELDWYESFQTDPGLTFYAIPARHYSGRALSRNKTLWAGFVIESPAHRLLLSGDSGYGPHYKAIGERFKSFDLVALDMGQYDPLWPYIHMTPEEASQAANDLNARALLPAHVGRFALASHAWDDPFKRITVASKDQNYRLLTPKIGEPVQLNIPHQTFSAWWKELH